jgi:hypothetical protein
MSRRTNRKAIPELTGLEARNLLSTLPSAGIAGTAEVRGFNPQPDPPGTDVLALGSVSLSGLSARMRPTESL